MMNKGHRTLGFQGCNLKSAAEKTRETSYKALLRPQLEYCAAIWDPYTKDIAKKIEMIQRRAARFVVRRYHQTSSVDVMLDQLS